MSIRKVHTKSGYTYDVTVYANRDENGNRRRVYERAPTLAEARAREAELKAQYSPREARRSAITLNRYIDSIYWPVASKRLSATSLDTYEKEIRLRIKPALGTMRLCEIERADIQTRMVDNCATACVARKALGTLKTILNEALADGYIKRNHACAKFALPPDSGKPRDNGLVLSTFDEIHELLDTVDIFSDSSVKRIAYTGLLLGLRPEERYALDWQCFDLQAETVTISEARIAATPKHGGVQNKDTKTKNSQRTIPLPPRFVDMLLSTTAPESGPFIIGAYGGRISPSTAQKRWRKFLSEHPECPPVTIENMRHSFATAYLSAGGKIEVLSRILGHANMTTTIAHYYRPDINALRADFERITCKSRALLHEQRLSSVMRVRFSAPPPLTEGAVADESGNSDECE